MIETKRYLNVTFVFIILISTGFCHILPVEQPVRNMETFARLYGYVKYFYPGDEAAAMDWDRFAIYGVKKVANAENTAALKQVLKELFLPIAPALVIHDANKKTGFSASSITPPDTTNMKVVTWQHLGVGLGDENSIYKSVRLNRKNKISGDNTFGTISAFLDVSPFKGKEIKFKAAVKIGEGKGQLWFRVDRLNGVMGFFDNMDNRPIQSTQWNYYEITGKVDTDAIRIALGCFLSGPGKLWVDDFQLYVKENDAWKPATIKNPDFEADKEGAPPAEWNSQSSSYSFEVTSETAGKGTKCVSIRNTPQFFSGELFAAKAAFGEYIFKELGSGLACVMPIALYGTEEQTYPPAPVKPLNDLKSAMDKEVPKELSGNDVYVRLGDIVIAWNIFQHFFPYFDVVKTDWRASLTEALESAANDKTDRDFLKTLRKFTAALKDGHIRVNLPGSSNEFYLPLVWELIEGQLVITEILDKTISNLRVGDVVKEIAGVKVNSDLEKEKLYISAATDGWLMYRALTELLRTPWDSEVTKLARETGEILEVSVKPAPIPSYYKMYQNREHIKSKKMKEGIYYLDLDSITMEEIDALMPELEKAQGIICDLRGYPAGNDRLISHLLKEKDTSTKWMQVPQVIYPDYAGVTFQNHGWEKEPLKPTLTAKIVFLTDGRAISYAESFMSFIEHYKLATIVGQPTAGTNGNINPFILPGRYYITWTGMRVVKHDGSQHHGVGIIPHVRVERTIKGVRAGRDEFLEKAVEIIERAAPAL